MGSLREALARCFFSPQLFFQRKDHSTSHSLCSPSPPKRISRPETQCLFPLYLSHQGEMKQTTLLPASQSFILRQLTLLDLLFTVIKQRLGHVSSWAEAERVHRFIFLGGMLLEAWGVLVPRPGNEPIPSAVEAWNLSH